MEIILPLKHHRSLLSSSLSLQDAAGETLSREAAVFSDGVWSDPHPPVRPEPGRHQLQDRGKASSGHLDSPCSTGRKCFYDYTLLSLLKNDIYDSKGC